jgi:predicted DNA binding CopG/RHH family protein
MVSSFLLKLGIAVPALDNRYSSRSMSSEVGQKSAWKKITYTEEKLGKVKVIQDFLPSPEKLALKEETVKVTISLSKASVEFFKNEAKKYHTQYQKMIRRLLDEYAFHHT